MHALDNLRCVCGNAHLFANLASDRQRLDDSNLQAMNRFAADATRKHEERLAAGGDPKVESQRLLEEIQEIGTLSTAGRRPDDYSEILDDLPQRGLEWCTKADDAIRDGGADILNAALTPGTLQKSTELSTKIDDAANVFRSLKLILRNPSLSMDTDVQAMTSLGNYFAAASKDLVAVLKQRSLNWRPRIEHSSTQTIEPPPPDMSELGHQMSCLIRGRPKVFNNAARWFQNWKTTKEKTNEDDSDPTPPHPQEGDKFFLTHWIMKAWHDVLRRFAQRKEADRWYDFCDHDACRIGLLAALTFDPDFDGTVLQLGPLPYRSEEPLDGRAFVWSAISSSAVCMEASRRATQRLERVLSASLAGSDSKENDDHASSPRTSEFPLKDEHLTILAELVSKARLVIATELESTSGMPKYRQLLRLLCELERGGYVERPSGSRSGWRATERGKDLAKQRGLLDTCQ